VLYQETAIQGVWVVELDRKADSRGYFARVFCQDEFAKRGLCTDVNQVNVGHNTRKGTVRGVHFQYPPHGEVKLVRATRGAVLDVAVDLRPESPTYLKHVAVELSDENGKALYVPERCGHGYQTLVDGTDLLYFTSRPWAPGFDDGLSPLDPALGLAWPLEVSELSAKDRGAKPFGEKREELERRMRI
jgi:dTDP-4-dehydrorhamnose 3,5-epimerase